MKKGEIFGLIIFIIGFLIKIFHAPFHAYLMMAGILVLALTYCFAAIRKTLAPSKILAGFTLVFGLLAVLFIVKYYPYFTALPFISMLLFLFSVGYHFIKKEVLNTRLVIAFVVVLAGIILHAMPSDTRYYAFNIRYNHMLEEDVQGWDRYSWFLYQNQKYQEAQNASAKALEISKKANDETWITLISDHNQKILNRNWHNFNKE